jgi:rare lipoprotein A
MQRDGGRLVRSRGGNAPAFALGLFIVASLATAGNAWAVAQCGEAAWYAPGGTTASGEPNAAGALTAAHPSLPFGTKVSVRNLANGNSVVLRINDRGSFAGDRIIDVSRAAADALDFIHDGVARVRVTVLGDVDVRLPGSCQDEVAAAGAEESVKPAADGSSVARPLSGQAMSARFSLAFQPDSWTEAELKKALEAFLPALRP